MEWFDESSIQEIFFGAPAVYRAPCKTRWVHQGAAQLRSVPSKRVSLQGKTRKTPSHQALTILGVESGHREYTIVAVPGSRSCPEEVVFELRSEEKRRLAGRGEVGGGSSEQGGNAPI